MNEPQIASGRLDSSLESKDELRGACSPSRRRVTRKLVNLDVMTQLTEGYRQQDKSVVFANGCFDLFHVGHVTYLQQACCIGDVLIVAMNSDASIRRLKGPDRPIIPQCDRVTLLSAMECVDHVLLFDEDTPVSLIERLRPGALVKGGEYRLDQVVGRDIVESYGGKVFLTDHIVGMSTTALIDRLKRLAT